MTLTQALHLIQSQQAAIVIAAFHQNPDALEVQTSVALFSQKPNTATAERLTQAADKWQAYRAENPQAEV